MIRLEVEGRAASKEEKLANQDTQEREWSDGPEGIPMLAWRGPLDHGTASAFQDQTLRKLSEDGGKGCLIVDLTGVGLIDSFGLAALVKTDRRCEERGGKLGVVASGYSQQVLEVSRLANRFPVNSAVDLVAARLREKTAISAA